MHELSIAMSLVEMATEEAERRGARVRALHLRLGPLSGVVKDALVSAYDLASEGTPIGGAVLVIDEVPVTVRCEVCREDRETRPHEWFSCVVCGTPARDVLSGRELELRALELES